MSCGIYDQEYCNKVSIKKPSNPVKLTNSYHDHKRNINFNNIQKKTSSGGISRDCKELIEGKLYFSVARE